MYRAPLFWIEVFVVCSLSLSLSLISYNVYSILYVFSASIRVIRLCFLFVPSAHKSFNGIRARGLEESSTVDKSFQHRNEKVIPEQTRKLTEEWEACSRWRSLTEATTRLGHTRCTSTCLDTILELCRKREWCNTRYNTHGFSGLGTCGK